MKWQIKKLMILHYTGGYLARNEFNNVQYRHESIKQ